MVDGELGPGEGPLVSFSEVSRRDVLKLLGASAASATAIGSVMAFLDACGNPSHGTTSLKPVRGGHIVEAIPSDPTGMNPLNIGGTDEFAIGNMFDGLLGFTPTGDFFPLLARSLPAVSSDGTTYTFTLRPDIKWTDGQPLTADDVVFTFELLYLPDFKAVRSPFRGDLQNVLASVTAPDPMTVVFRTKGVNAPFLANHARRYIVPKHVLGNVAAANINTHPFMTMPTVSMGPFKFVEWVKGDHVTLTRNDTCYRGAAYLDKWIWKTVPDTNNFLGQLKTGEVDVGRFFSWGSYDDLKSTPNLNVDVFQRPSGTRYIYQMDPNRPAGRIFSDRAVRQALGYAVDYEGIKNAVYFKIGALTAVSQVPPLSWAYNSNVKPRYTYDPKKAASMLDAAGWKVGSSGVREKDGIPMRFEIIASVESPEWTNSANVMQQNWKAIGVDAHVNAIPFVQLLSKVAVSRDFDLSIYTLSGGFPDPDLSLWFSSAAAASGGFNGMQYKNPALDQLLKDAASTVDRAKRRDLYFKIQDQLNEDAPSLPLHIWNAMWVRNKRVQNYAYPTHMGPAIVNSSRPLINQVFVNDGK